MKRSRTLLNLALVVAGLGAAAPALVGGATATVAQGPDGQPAEMVLAATEADCASSLTRTGGVPWRAGACAPPAFSNHVIPSSPALNARETDKLASLSGAILNIDEYSEPIYYSTKAKSLRKVSCVAYGCVGGSSAPITGKEVVAPGSDGQVVIVDMERRRSYEMYQVRKDADGTVRINGDGSVTVGSMSVVDLDGRGNKTADGRNLNITGAGVSRIFGVIRANEVRAAATKPRTAIRHALQVSLPSAMNCSKVFRAPATKTDGRATSSSCIAEGARVQLRPSVDCTAVRTKLGQAVCFAMKKYGAYNMDNNGSSSMVFYGQHRRSWSGGGADYAAVGIKGDYQSLGLSPRKMRVLSSWTGR